METNSPDATNPFLLIQSEPSTNSQEQNNPIIPVLENRNTYPQMKHDSTTVGSRLSQEPSPPPLQRISSSLV